MPLVSRNSAFTQVTTLAAQRPVHTAFAWLHGNPKTIMDWQTELVAIPLRCAVSRRGLNGLLLTSANLACTMSRSMPQAMSSATIPAAKLPPESTGPVVVLSAHLDTVFPAGIPIDVTFDGDRLSAPGACDNAAGVAGMLAVVHALLQRRKSNLPRRSWCSATSAKKVKAISAACAISTTRALSPAASRPTSFSTAPAPTLPSRRPSAAGAYQVTVNGPGGHSFTDAGTPNPIAALAVGARLVGETPLPDEPAPRSTSEPSHGGTSVNSIPESAHGLHRFPLHQPRSAPPPRGRSASRRRRCRRALEREGACTNTDDHRGPLSFSITKIGDRPAAKLPDDSPLLETLRAVDRHLGPAHRSSPRLNRRQSSHSHSAFRLSPWAPAAKAVAHTPSTSGTSPRIAKSLSSRILLLTLAMTEWAAEQ